MRRRTVMDMLRDARTPHDPETGEVLGEAVKPLRAPTAAQLAVQSRAKRKGFTPEIAEAPDIRMSGSMADALRGMVDRPFLKSQKYQDQQWRAVREGAHPDILEFERRMVRRMAKLGVPMFGHCVVRSLEQQAIEFAQGDSKVKFGAHNVGCAIDLVHGTKAWGLTDPQWDLVGHCGKEIITQGGLALVNFRWGGPDGPGDKFDWDPAHWEIADWKSVQAEYPWLEAT